jgi:heat shock protein HslJ
LPNSKLSSCHSSESWNPAFLAAFALISLAACTPTPPPSTPAQERYTAHGQEPGWALTITHGRIDYVGDYGNTRISVPRPDPRTTFNGHRYETARLTVDITHGRCNDAMSGQGFADQVMVIADGKTVRGCGGDRHTEWDM